MFSPLQPVLDKMNSFDQCSKYLDPQVVVKTTPIFTQEKVTLVTCPPPIGSHIEVVISR